MFAVIKTGGKQYRVAANDEFEIERLVGEAGDSVSFTEVLMVGTAIGAPFVAGATVVAEIVRQTRGPKVISFKKRRRQNSKRTRGHRQDLTRIRIAEILTDGQTSSRPAKAAANDAAPVSGAEPDAAEPKSPTVTAAETADAAAAPATVNTAPAAPARKPRTAKKKTEAADEA